MANIPENTTDPILRPVTRLETTTKVFGGEYIPNDEQQRGISNLQAIELAERDQYIISRVGQAKVDPSGDIPGEVGIAPLDTSGKLPKSNNTSGVVFTSDTQTLTNKTYVLGGANKVCITNSSNQMTLSTVSDTELEHLSGVTSNVQTQLNGKQATITGAASTITSSNLTASKVLVSDANGKVSASSCPSNRIGVGQVHSATVVSPFTGDVTWCVTNGLCYVQIWNLYNSYTDGVQRTIATGLPKAKMGGSNYYFSNVLYVFEGETYLKIEPHAVGNTFTSLVYPVSDDWVES